MKDGGKQQKKREMSNQVTISEEELHSYEKCDHLRALLAELIQQTPWNSPIRRNLIQVLEAGFTNEEETSDSMVIEGLSAKDMFDLLGVDKSMVSRAKHDNKEDNLFFYAIKYPLGVTWNRLEHRRVDLIWEAVEALSTVHSGTGDRYCRFLRKHVLAYYKTLCTEEAVEPV